MYINAHFTSATFPVVTFQISAWHREKPLPPGHRWKLNTASQPSLFLSDIQKISLALTAEQQVWIADMFSPKTRKQIFSTTRRAVALLMKN